ncbi:hypothetical protein MRX96_026217 [Rhipicephalus microplus]
MLGARELCNGIVGAKSKKVARLIIERASMSVPPYRDPRTAVPSAQPCTRASDTLRTARRRKTGELKKREAYI